MTIIVFLVDTSASMNQKTYIGPSFMDLAKGAVDTFLKFRARDPSARGADRYMLLTFEEPPKHVKAGWRESQAVFMQELKNLKSMSITTVGSALGNTLHYLNVNRLQTGIDNFGAGRFPHWLEPAAIILITDGGCMVHPNGTVRQTIEITPSQIPGSELVVEPFRWDQRIFSLVLRLPGHAPKVATAPGMSLVPPDKSALDAICEATGGRSYSITTHKMINQCLESLVQKIQSGGVVCFEKYGPDPPPVSSDDRPKGAPLENGFIHQVPKLGTNSNHITSNNIGRSMECVQREKNSSRPSSPSPSPSEPAWAKTRRMIYVARGFGTRMYITSHWTIPEAYWPDPSVTVLPPRTAHPIIRFKCEPRDAVNPQDLPFDKYELEPSPLTQFILERRQPNVCWYCYISNSGVKSGDLGAPFAFLKASSQMNSVNLVVLPYNFPVLLPLLDEIKITKGKPTSQWKAKFDSYLKGVPPYYIPSMKAAFQKMNLGHLLADVSDKYLSVSVQAHLGKVKLRAREEFDRLNQSVGQPLPAPEGARVIPRSTVSSLLSSNKLLREGIHQVKIDATEFVGFRIHVVPDISASKSTSTTGQCRMGFRNPFDVDRDKLLTQIAKMRVNLKQNLHNGPSGRLSGAKPGMKYRLQDVEELHQLPISSMGNYQEYLRLMAPPLREIDATPARLHAFGNPFKVDKRMLVDEADIDNLVGSATTSSSSSSSGSGTSGRAHSKRSSSISSDSSGSSRHSSSSSLSQLSHSRKRRPGPLPKDFRYSKRKKRSDGGVESDTDDDRSIISCPFSPAPSDISVFSDGDEETNEILATPEFNAMANMEDTSAGSLTIDEETERRDIRKSSDEETSARLVMDDQIASASNVDGESGVNSETSKFRPRTTSVAVNGPNSTGKKKTRSISALTTAAWTDLRKEISALVRKPSQDYRQLFEKIGGLQQYYEKEMCSWALSEADRFRRTDLMDRLRKRLLELERKTPHKPNQPKRSSER